jgi:hypothetical protein
VQFLPQLFLRPSFFLVALNLVISGGFVRGAETARDPAKPVQLGTVVVTTIWTTIKLRPIYRDFPGGARINRLRIEEVRKKSPAERAGLTAGMEVLAINGVTVQGITEDELNKLCLGPFSEDFLTLKVINVRPGLASPPYAIRVPLPKPPPMAISVRVDFGETPGKSPSVVSEVNPADSVAVDAMAPTEETSEPAEPASAEKSPGLG